MSEPMSAVEIEDVLSSIRRLVSEELRPMSRAARAEPEPALPVAKLILTPALRVVPDSQPDPEPDPEPEHAPEPAAADDAALFATPDDTAAMAWAHEADEEGDVTRIDGLLFQGRAAVQADDADILGAPSETSHDPVVYHGEVLDPDEDAAERTEAWAQEGPAEESDLTGAIMVEEIAEAVDAAWMDRAEAEVMAALSEQRTELDAQDTAPETDPVAAAASGELQIDGSVLRDLVRDLIREELQGALGERITRNVRKLVRVEVARALSLHDLD